MKIENFKTYNYTLGTCGELIASGTCDYYSLHMEGKVYTCAGEYKKPEAQTKAVCNIKYKGKQLNLTMYNLNEFKKTEDAITLLLTTARESKWIIEKTYHLK